MESVWARWQRKRSNQVPSSWSSFGWDSPAQKIHPEGRVFCGLKDLSSLQLLAADYDCMHPSARTKRGPQDDTVDGRATKNRALGERGSKLLRLEALGARCQINGAVCLFSPPFSRVASQLFSSRASWHPSFSQASSPLFSSPVFWPLSF